jgi:NADH-quinone oxidoreductase subunit G
MEQMGPWDGARPAAPQVPAAAPATGEGLVLASWKQMLDDASLLDGDKHLAATARPAVARVAPSAHAALGDTVTLTGDRGTLTLPVVPTAGLLEGVVWVPARSAGGGVLADLASPGTRVTVRGAEQ